ncbi:MAG: cation transporter [Brevinematales bacterium]|jgi:divalent metal cation (Fe/Co/Zn/Cd) transporter
MNNKHLWNIALLLAVITVFYNFLEGLASVYFGTSGETVSLFGFGIDSFIEVMSGIGVWHMIVRIKNNNNENSDDFEKTALKITGISFYILTAGLAVTIAYNIYTGHKPQTTVWGIIISSISIIAMTILMRFKLNTGKILKSAAVIADANCTRTCLYLSIILLLSSAAFQIFKIGFIDTIGAIGIAYYSFKEGRESMEKAAGKKYDCEDD